MPLTLRPTGLGSGIDKDRPDYTVYPASECRPHLRDPRRSRQSALVLVADRQQSDDALGSRGDPGGGQGAISEELGRVEGVGEAGRGRLGLPRAGAAAEREKLQGKLELAKEQVLKRTLTHADRPPKNVAPADSAKSARGSYGGGRVGLPAVWAMSTRLLISAKVGQQARPINGRGWAVGCTAGAQENVARKSPAGAGLSSMRAGEKGGGKQQPTPKHYHRNGCTAFGRLAPVDKITAPPPPSEEDWGR